MSALDQGTVSSEAMLEGRGMVSRVVGWGVVEWGVVEWGVVGWGMVEWGTAKAGAGMDLNLKKMERECIASGGGYAEAVMEKRGQVSGEVGWESAKAGIGTGAGEREAEREHVV